MPDTIRVTSVGIGTSDWRVTLRDTGRPLYDLHLDLDATLRGRYYVIVDGEVRREGTFAADAWDEAAVRELLTRIIRSDYRDADVEVEVARPRIVRTA